MTNPLHVHDLSGCAPAPLANYLKALAILRLVSEQADPGTRGWWEGERFRLATRLSREELERFFLEDYAPTPILAPWGKASGFYKKKDPTLSKFEGSVASRFLPFRVGILASRELELLSSILNADQEIRAVKESAQIKGWSKSKRDAFREMPAYKKALAEATKVFNDLKDALIPSISMKWRGDHARWLASVFVLNNESDAKFPALLGTGGNDGALDFTKSSMQRIAELFDLKDAFGRPFPASAGKLKHALWGISTAKLSRSVGMGQFLPDTVGGANSGNGADGASFDNAFNYVFVLEGALSLTSSATKRLGTLGDSKAVAPFAVSFGAGGYASRSSADDSLDGEQWMPLWAQPCTQSEVTQIFRDGRASVNRKSVRDSLDIARSIAGLGASRGIFAFARYGYIERNGQSNLAIPLGQFSVPERANSRLDAFADIDNWLVKLKRIARDKDALPSVIRCERDISDSAFALFGALDNQENWQRLLIALGRFDSNLRLGIGAKAGAVPKLSAPWTNYAADVSPEFRLALAFAFQAQNWFGDKAVDRIRRHLLPLDRFGRYDAKATAGGVVIHRRNAITDLSNVVLRRVVEGSPADARRFALQAGRGCDAHLADMVRLLSNNIDLNRVLDLACGLMAVDASAWVQLKHKPMQALPKAMPPEPWCAIRLAHLPFALADGQRIPVDPAITRRLMSDDVPGAVELALRRLGAHGIRPVFKSAAAATGTGPLWAASLAFPISEPTAARLLRQLDPSNAAITNADQPTH